ncbi:type II toxin-antitoxin system VapC family toxin [Anthocerotibacter panamensis]|uniref:type II toxin-antitoxin system VapC family toxin n=1 Tax=Anthocerotibacter panamensis TaxID=2857077 RepID=UPI001C403941|nr:type II toxin-antitoxin system VapC family toxin [Anthocerotibacter panamensis]
MLDTHLAFWWQADADRISPTARKLVQEADQVRVSRVSQWELVIKADAGKLHIDLPLFTQQVAVIGFSWLPIESAHMLMVASLPRFDDHKDPFDRLLVAQSLSEPLIFLTADTKLARYGTTVHIV